jgi:hypothetical protein
MLLETVVIFVYCGVGINRYQSNMENEMKTIIHRKSRNFDGLVVENAVKRLPNKEAEYLVKNDGWEYCPKSVYKRVRDAEDPNGI